jgi:drug/metabolite transporter (DMT)-like permease
MHHLAAIAGAVGISFSAIYMRLADVSGTTAALYRSIYALPALAAVWLVVRGRDHRDARARGTAFAAGLFLGIDLVMWDTSIDAIGAGLATVLANLQVVFVGLVAWAVYREAPSRIAVATIPVVLGGVTLISGLGASGAYGDDPLRGVLFGIGTAGTYAGFLILLRHSNRRHLAPTAGPLLDATVGAAAISLVAGLFDTGFELAPSWPAHGWLLALALGTQVVSWLLITTALPRLPALETSVILLVQPVGSILWARLIFSERLSTLQWAGAVVVIAGVAMMTSLGTMRRTPVTPTSEAGRPPG